MQSLLSMRARLKGTLTHSFIACASGFSVFFACRSVTADIFVLHGFYSLIPAMQTATSYLQQMLKTNSFFSIFRIVVIRAQFPMMIRCMWCFQVCRQWFARQRNSNGAHSESRNSQKLAPDAQFDSPTLQEFDDEFLDIDIDVAGCTHMFPLFLESLRDDCTHMILSYGGCASCFETQDTTRNLSLP